MRNLIIGLGVVAAVVAIWYFGFHKKGESEVIPAQVCQTCPTGPIQVTVAPAPATPSEVVLMENPTTRWMRRSSGEVVYQASADGVPICHAPSGSDLVKCPAEVYVDIATVVAEPKRGSVVKKKFNQCDQCAAVAALDGGKRPPASRTSSCGAVAPPASVSSGPAAAVWGGVR